MKKIAEGVEHFEQVVYLREHGISAAQGFVRAAAAGSAFVQLVEAVNVISAELPGRCARRRPYALAMIKTARLHDADPLLLTALDVVR